jgi:hypothetical protein
VESLAEVLRRHWAQYERQFGAAILPSHRRAVQAILNCRTRALGGEVYRCVHCHQDHFVYHSCNHRACPQCGQAAAGQWIERQRRKLLPVPYYLITFTVPEELRAWLRSHQKTGYGLLLKESAGALQDVAGRDKYLGAELGILSVLHTWGRQLQFHPHVHCIVPAGGLRPDRLRWCRPKSADYFLPQAVLADRFRTRLTIALQTQADGPARPAAGRKQHWVVDVQLVGSGEAALQYLSAYVYRTALGPQRIVAVEDQHVTFKFKDRQDQQWHTLRVTAHEFIRRYLQQVLPQGFQRVRYYGWLSAAANVKRERILALLNGKVSDRPEAATPQPVCARCGQLLCWVATLGRAPP